MNFLFYYNVVLSYRIDVAAGGLLDAIYFIYPTCTIQGVQFPRPCPISIRSSGTPPLQHPGDDGGETMSLRTTQRYSHLFRVNYIYRAHPLLYFLSTGGIFYFRVKRVRRGYILVTRQRRQYDGIAYCAVSNRGNRGGLWSSTWEGRRRLIKRKKKLNASTMFGKTFDGRKPLE